VGVEDYHIHLDHIFFAETEEEAMEIVLNNREIASFKWFTVTEINELNTFENVSQICSLLLKKIGVKAMVVNNKKP